LLLRNNEQNTRVFIHGKPGTGKTTFVKEISRDIKKEILYVNAQNLISSKLGETQKNLDLLLNDCIKSAGKYIILMDEFDSIIGSRNREIHDEYHRLIGSFNIFLDTLPKNIILFAITNVISHIDEATLRRFNVDILLNEIDLNVFTFQLFNQATLNKIDYNINVSRKLVHINSQSLDYSSIEKIVTNSQIEKCSIETSIAKILSIDDVSKLRKLGLTLDDIAVVKKISKAGVAKILGSKK
jgi:AAA+ superfamily predicted ATPase